MLDGLSETSGPPGFMLTFRFMIPVSPFTLVAVIAEVPEEPVARSKNMGFAERVKSGPDVTSTVAEIFLTILPLDPVTVTV